MKNATVGEPVLFVLWFRPRRGERWKKLGRYGSRGEAVTAISGRGDFRITESRCEPAGQYLVLPLTDARLAGGKSPDAARRE